MKLSQRKLSLAFIVVYVACVIISAYSLFTLKNDLTFSSGVLDIADWPATQGLFIKLNFIILATMLVGLGACVFLFSNGKDRSVQLEKKTHAYVSENDDDEQVEEEVKIDLNPLKTVLAEKNVDNQELLKKSLNEVCNILQAGLGAFYGVSSRDGKKIVEMKSSYALALGESQMPSYEFGEGLVGQVASEQKTLNINDIPDGYVKIVSGLGNASPTNLLVSPVIHKGELYGVIEIASFTPFGANEEDMLKKAFEMITEKLGGEEKKPVKKSTKKDNE